MPTGMWIRWRPTRWPMGWPAALLALSCTLPAPTAQAAQITAGAGLTALPASLVDPLGSLVLAAGQFVVPLQVQGADALAGPLTDWQVDLRFDATVATPLDAGGLFQSVYQADFGGGAVSQITGSGLLLAGRLDALSGFFAPGVSGDGVIAYVLFAYLAGHDGQDPGVQVDDPDTPPQPVPEPASLALVAAALLAAWWSARRSARLNDRPAQHHPTLPTTPVESPAP